MSWLLGRFSKPESPPGDQGEGSDKESGSQNDKESFYVQETKVIIINVLCIAYQLHPFIKSVA